MSRSERFQLKCAAYVIPRRGDDVLLSLRKNTGWMDGYYSLIAGHLEARETIEEAAIREAKEEGGVALHKENLQFVHVLHRLKDDPKDGYIDMFFECHDWDGEFVNAEPDKCGGLEWFDVNHLPDNILPYIKDVIEMSVGRVYFSVRRAEA